MKKRIKEIIAYIIDPDSVELRNPAALHSELEDMGYSYDEITQALNMIDFESLTEDRGLRLNSNVNNRILGESEKLILSTRAQGYILMLHSLGWLSEAQLSLIIENAALEFSPPVSVDEIKEITSRYVVDLPEDDPPYVARPDGQVH